VNSIIVPWNHEPITTVQGATADSYTVPAGKYSRVSIIMAVYASGAVLIASPTTATIANATNDSLAVEKVVWMKAGQELTFTTEIVNTTPLVTTAGQIQTLTDNSKVTALIDSNEIAVVEVVGSATGGDSTNTASLSISGSATARFTVEEYNILT